MESDLEIKLIDKALAGDKRSFGILADEYFAYCFAIANNIIDDKDVAKDLVQNGLMEAYFCLSNLRDKSTFKNWLSGIVRNLCKQYFRQNNKQYLSLRHYYEELHDPGSFEEERVVNIVLNAIKSLDTPYQRVVYLFYYEGKSIDEICDELLITTSLVKVRLHRARRKLRGILEFNSELKEYQQYFRNRNIMKKVRIIDMVLGGGNNSSCSVLLYDEDSFRVLPIVITTEEAETMLIAMKGIDFPRPMTFNLITEIIRTNNLELEGVYVTEILSGVFISTLKLKSNGKVKEYDSRPSDAITIALMFGCPIFVSSKILDKAGFPVPEKYKSMTPQEKGIESLTQQIENSLFEMKTKLDSFKKKKSANDIQKQINRLMNYVFEDNTSLNQDPA